MSFNKEEQRRRAAEFAQQQLAKGAKPVAPMPVPVSIPRVVQAAAKPIIAAKAKAVKAPKKVNYDVDNGTNHLGQTLHPGAKVIVVTQGYSHSTHIRRGVFLGVRGSRFVVRVEDNKRCWVDKTGNVVRYKYGQNLKMEYRTVLRQTTLCANHCYPTI